MLLHLLRAATPGEHTWLVDFLGAPEAERTDADVEQVRDWMERHGSLEYARAYGDWLAAAADVAFEAAFADVPPLAARGVHPRVRAVHAGTHRVGASSALGQSPNRTWPSFPRDAVPVDPWAARAARLVDVLPASTRTTGPRRRGARRPCWPRSAPGPGTTRSRGR